MHLAKADAKDLWAKLEGDWNKLQSEVKHVSSAANRSAQDVGAASELLFSSIKEGYQKIKQSLPKT